MGYMCGRFAVTTDPALLAEKIQAIDESTAAHKKDTRRPQLQRRADHHDQHRGQTAQRARRRVDAAGAVDALGPGAAVGQEAEDGGPDTKGPLLINARAEKVTTSPAFRNSAKSKRCLVPMDGWYEWRPNGERLGKKAPKTPFYMYGADGEPLFMAGLWSTWRPKVRRRTARRC